MADFGHPRLHMIEDTSGVTTKENNTPHFSLRCNVLQCPAVCCNVLQCVERSCVKAQEVNTLHFSLCCSVLQCIWRQALVKDTQCH